MISTILSWIEAHAGLAAWVQAMGSITALGVAIYAPYWQAQVSATSRKKQFLRSFAALVVECLNVLDTILLPFELIPKNQKVERSERELAHVKALQHALDQISPTAFEGYLFARWFIQLKRELARIAERLAAAANDDGGFVVLDRAYLDISPIATDLAEVCKIIIAEIVLDAGELSQSEFRTA